MTGQIDMFEPQKPISQKDRILNHLRTYESITDNDARDMYGINRCGARIWDLRQEGHDIKTVMESCKNRYGIKTEYGRYFLNQ